MVCLCELGAATSEAEGLRGHALQSRCWALAVMLWNVWERAAADFPRADPWDSTSCLCMLILGTLPQWGSRDPLLWYSWV